MCTLRLSAPSCAATTGSSGLRKAPQSAPAGLPLHHHPTLHQAPLLSHRLGKVSVRSKAPERRDFEDPTRYPDLPHGGKAGEHLHPSPEAQEAARQAGTPEHVMAREQDLDLHAVSHADRAQARLHTFSEVIHGQAGERAVQHGMSEDQRRLMQEHLEGKEGKAHDLVQAHATSAPPGRMQAEDPRAYGAADEGSAGAPAHPAHTATADSPVEKQPDVGSTTASTSAPAAAVREGGSGQDDAEAAEEEALVEEAPGTAGGPKPRQSWSYPVDDYE